MIENLSSETYLVIRGTSTSADNLEILGIVVMAKPSYCYITQWLYLSTTPTTPVISLASIRPYVQVSLDRVG